MSTSTFYQKISTAWGMSPSAWAQPGVQQAPAATPATPATSAAQQPSLTPQTTALTANAAQLSGTTADKKTLLGS